MARFIYFVEGRPKLDQKFVTESGLAYAFEDNPKYTELSGTNTPTGKPGVLFAATGTALQLMQFNKEKQKWRKVIGSDAWMGYWLDDLPKAKDLVRAVTLQGNTVKVKGENWVVPLVRDAGGNTQLPLYLDVDDDGKWTSGGLSPTHEDIWNRAGDFMEMAFANVDEKGDTTFEMDDLWDTVALLLSQNYYISKNEIALGRYLTQSDAVEILRAANDWRELMKRFDELAKKNDLPDESGQSTDDGKQDSPPDTDQHGAM